MGSGFFSIRPPPAGTFNRQRLSDSTRPRAVVLNAEAPCAAADAARTTMAEETGAEPSPHGAEGTYFENPSRRRESTDSLRTAASASFAAASPRAEGAKGPPSIFDSAEIELEQRAPVTVMILESSDVLKGGAMLLRYRLQNVAQARDH